MSDIKPTLPNDEAVKSDNVVPLTVGKGPTSGPRRTSKGPRAAFKRPTSILKFSQDEGDPSPASVLIALRYQFEAIDHILGSHPGDAHFECMASYLALAGAAAVRSLEKRTEDCES